MIDFDDVPVSDPQHLRAFAASDQRSGRPRTVCFSLRLSLGRMDLPFGKLMVAAAHKMQIDESLEKLPGACPYERVNRL